VNNAPMPAPPARIRSMKLPWATSSRSTRPARAARRAADAQRAWAAHPYLERAAILRPAGCGKSTPPRSVSGSDPSLKGAVPRLALVAEGAFGATISSATPLFDDENLVSCAGLVPVMALAQRAGLSELIGEYRSTRWGRRGWPRRR
jgi:hypothetical protein